MADAWNSSFHGSFDDDFHGAKLALFIGADLVVIRRHDRPDIPWPGALDLTGCGREGQESPVDCVLRETFLARP